MRQQKALVVGDRSPATDHLRAILRDEQLDVAVVAAAGVADHLRVTDVAATTVVVLVSSSLRPSQIRAIRETVVPRTGGAAQVVVFAESIASQLDGHVRAGLDYLVPPFSHDVVRRRLASAGVESAQSVENATHLAQYEKEMEIGREIQQGFLPGSIPTHEGWQIEVRFHPARQVAGDFYDAFDLVNGRRVGFIVADVCDKGVGAALFMALIRSLLRNTASHPGSLSVIGLDVEWDPTSEPEHALRTSATSAGVGPLLNAVTGTDEYMVQNHLYQGYFATLFFGMLDPATGSVVYINCGHNPPVVRRSNGTQVVLEPTGPALGMLPGSSFRLGRVHLEMGDLLYLYTDGVTEAKDESGGFFTEERMRTLVAESGAEDAAHLLSRFDTALHGHIGDAEQFDDITMMAVYRHPEPTSAMGAAAATPATWPGR